MKINGKQTLKKYKTIEKSNEYKSLGIKKKPNI